jgi:hypothetical protein
MEDLFDNKDRDRYYGLRKGDTIRVHSLNGTVWGTSVVLDYTSDNNRVIIESRDGSPIDWVAEWCEILTKIEDKPTNNKL